MFIDTEKKKEFSLSWMTRNHDRKTTFIPEAPPSRGWMKK